jgi:prepilin-type N-terminal cleavage/methylation domain-containing protein
MVHRYSKGFTLAEVVVSMALIAIVWVSAFNSFVTGVSSASLANHKAKALYIAAETIELWRKLPFSGTGCMASDGPRQINMDTNQVNDTSAGFCGTRSVTVTATATHYKKVAVDISWTERLALSAKTMHETLAAYIADDPQAN